MIVNVTVRVDWVERPTMPLPNGAKTAAEMMRSALFGGNGFVPSSAYPDDPVELRQLPGQFGHVITEEDIEVEAARYRLERALLKPDKVEAMYRGEMSPPVVVAREGFAEMQRLQNRRAWARRDNYSEARSNGGAVYGKIRLSPSYLRSHISRSSSPHPHSVASSMNPSSQSPSHSASR